MSVAGPSVVTLTLPWPPSTNHYWRHINRGTLAGRVLLSEAGRVYRSIVQGEVYRLGLHRDRLSGRLSVAVGACPPDRRRRDLDNLLKATLDALTHAGVIEDDSLIDDLRIVRGAVVPGGELRIVIEPVVQAAE